ncbi:unnamed protein product [Staurois parvus]|uniref:Uncharacterized protein n=1 Tax=Staurois parvus TaxID=386267 RepID=A0ABN9ABX9_9NEOB|nr:unnamed protein product [Staurois parvus]
MFFPMRLIRGGLTIRALGHCRGPGVSRGPHEMPLVPFIGFFWCGQGHRGPMIPYCPGAP